ncbi:MAG: DUF2490 domain-containing protein [Vampirovibrionales bacterium]
MQKMILTLLQTLKTPFQSWTMMLRLLTLGSILSGFLSGARLAFAEDGLTSDSELWQVVTFTAPITPNKKGVFFVDGILRTQSDMQRLSLAAIRPALGYRFAEGKGLVLAGYGYLHRPWPNNAHEHHLYQQVSYRQSLLKDHLRLTHRVRFEERYIEHEPIFPRVRLQERMEIPLNKKKTVSVVVWDEIFLNMGNSTQAVPSGFAVQRLFVGLNKRFTPAMDAEGGYMIQLVNRSEPNPNVLGHCVFLRINFVKR